MDEDAEPCLDLNTGEEDALIVVEKDTERTYSRQRVLLSCDKRSVMALVLLGISVLVALVLVSVPAQKERHSQQGAWDGSVLKDAVGDKELNDILARESNSKDPSVSLTSEYLCNPLIQCETDRWGNSQQLKLGHSMCNDEWRFGVSKLGKDKGALLWQDCNLDRLLVLQEVNSTDAHLAFQLTDQGFFQVLDKSGVLWQLEPNPNQGPITSTARCLTDPVMGCPYLHLRKRGGNIVLNWIGSTGWNARKVHRVYPGLFPADFK